MASEIETVGVLPVPEAQRTMRPWGLFIVWLMASASATTPIVGMLLYGYGLWYLIGAIVVAWLVAAVPAGLFSEMGREVPLTALVVARKTFGYDGSFWFSVLFTLVNLGWFGLNTAVGGEILAAVTHSSRILWDVIVGVVELVLVLFGMKWLERFYRYTTVALIVCYAALIVYLFLHFPLHTPAQTEPMNWGKALTTVLTISLFAWAYKLSTSSRFCVSADRTGGQRPSYFLAASVGIMLAVLVMGVVGAYSKEATGNWNIALLGAHITGWGEVAAIGAALAVLHTNAMNLYPSTVDLLVAVNTLHHPSRWHQPVATILLGAAGTVLAVAGILSHVSTFLNDSGDIIIPFTLIMLVDWIWVQRKRTPVEEFFHRPNRLSHRWNWAAFVAFVIGFGLSYWGQQFLPPICYNVFPLPVFGGVVAAVVYAVLGIRADHTRPLTGHAPDPAEQES